jgi:anti-sigma factor RsiW
VSEGSRPIGEDDLQGWVDGLLPPERQAEVEAWLEGNPAEATRLAAYREQRDRLRAWLAPRAAECVPLRLRPEALFAARRARRLYALRSVAACALLLLVGGLGGWFGRDLAFAPSREEPALLAADAVQAHLTFVTEVRHPVEVDAQQEAHLVTWLSNRLGRKLRVPDLTGFGLHLMGGRLLPGESVPAAQFMFSDDRGTRLTLYLRAEPIESGTGFEIVQRGPVAGFRWFEDGFGYVVLAETSRERLLQVAEAVYRQEPAPK